MSKGLKVVFFVLAVAVVLYFGYGMMVALGPRM